MLLVAASHSKCVLGTTESLQLLTLRVALSFLVVAVVLGRGITRLPGASVAGVGYVALFAAALFDLLGYLQASHARHLPDDVESSFQVVWDEVRSAAGAKPPLAGSPGILTVIVHVFDEFYGVGDGVCRALAKSLPKQRAQMTRGKRARSRWRKEETLR